MLMRALLSCCMPALLLILLTPISAQGCSVPVFYFALGKWTPSAHRIESLPAVASADIAQHLQHSNATLVAGSARLRAFFPGVAKPWWDEAPDASAVDARLALMLDSPQRAELVRRLASGESGVWVLLSSGDKAKDDGVADMLSRRLRRVEAAAVLPTKDAEAQAAGSTDEVPDLAVAPRLAFSVLRVDRQDPAEAGFSAQLAALTDNPAARALPILVPVFGRGRALGALCGSDLTEAHIDDDCLYLVGSCSCQAKEMNVGVDLLVHADWDRLVAKPLVAAPTNH